MKREHPRRDGLSAPQRHVVKLTDAGIDLLAKAEFALAAVEDEVLGGLDHDEREMLYRLLAQATTDHVVDCAEVAAEC